jgi:hypothetical protein
MLRGGGDPKFAWKDDTGRFSPALSGSAIIRQIYTPLATCRLTSVGVT